MASGTDRNLVDGSFPKTYDLSSNGIAGPIVLRTSDVDLDRIRYGLELMAALQTGPCASVEGRVTSV